MSDYRKDSLLPAQSIILALNKARSLFAADMNEALAGTNVTCSQVGTLLLLSRDTARTSVSLAKLLCVDPGFVTRTVDRLERQSLVRRDRNSSDRRVVNLTLTEAGQNLSARIAEIVPAVLNQRLSVLTPLEFAALCSLLGKLLDE